LNTATTDTFPQDLIDVAGNAWRLNGEGVLSWSVFKLYRARLFVMGENFDAQQPFVLELSYLRTLTAQQIVSTSIEEIKRLRGVSPDALKQWSDALMRIVPDVVLGDRLVGWFRPGLGVKFYSATQALGVIDDAVFVESFSAIWLDEQTHSPSLRESLLGGARATHVLGA